MDTKKHLLPLSAALVALLFAAYPGVVAFAESDDRGVSAGASVQVKVEADTHERSSAGTTTSADNEEESDSEEMESGSSRGSGATTTTRGEDADEQEDDEDMDDEIKVDHEDALVATTTIEDPKEVHNRGELRSFLNHVVKEDDRIADVQVSSTSVETKYALPARFLWAIPTSLPAQVSVGVDGSVTITYPWYAFLFAKQDDEIKTQLTEAASSTIEAGTSTKLSASTQAHLLNLILSVLKGN